MKSQGMMAQSVCAVLVTFHPSGRMIEDISGVLAQVSGMVVVDNGSNGITRKRLRSASHAKGFQLIENEENVGLAEALNQGVRWAKSQGYPWVILFDQDSRLTNSFITEMRRTWESHPERDRVASIHPRYLDPQAGTEPLVRRASDGGPVLSITSGALMPAWIFDKIGWFASEYFIDCVDFEYCFRIRALGYLIADSRDAVLLHAAGHAGKRLSFLGFNYRPTHHSPLRRYYMSRNRVAVVRKYFPIFPGWVMQFIYDCSRETIKCFVAERGRPRKLRNFLRGTWDGLTGRMGKREGL
jgi:rhamnosyltransferase